MTRRHVKKTSNKRNNHQNISLILMGFGFILVIGILILFLPAFNSADKKIDDFSADDLPSAIPAPVDFQAPDVQYHIDLYGLTFPVWLDFKQASIRAFQNGSLPNSYVIDGSGQVRYTWTGAINRKTLEQFITPLLEE